MTLYSMQKHSYPCYPSNLYNKFNLINLLLVVVISLFALPCKAKPIEALQPDADEDTEIFSKGSESQTYSNYLDSFYEQLEDPFQVAPLANQKARTLFNQGLKNLQEGNATQGRTQLIQAWEEDPGLIIAATMLSASYLQAKEYQQALEIAQQLQSKYPDKPEGFILAGIAFAGMDKQDEAKAAFQAVIELKPDDVDANLNLAQYAIADQDFNHARQLYAQALEGNPGNLQIILKLAQLEYISGQPQQSITILEDALKKHPNNIEARLLLAKIYLLSGRYNDILILTEGKSVERPELMELRGKAQTMMGDMPSAIESFKQIQSSIPDNASAHFRFANYFVHTGDLDNAKKELERSIQLDSNFLPARIGEVKLLVMSNDFEQAEKKLAALRKDFSENAEVLAIAGWASLKQHDYKAASTLFELAAKQKQTSNLTELWCLSLMSQQRYAEGMQVLTDWLAKNPRDIVILNTLADTLLAFQNYDQAIKVYQQILELNPLFTPALNNLAMLLKDRDLEQAISLAEAAHQQDSSNPIIKDTLGTLLLQSGDLERGSSILGEASQLAQEDWAIQYNYAQALVKQTKYPQARERLNAIISGSTETAVKTKAQQLLNSLP